MKELAGAQELTLAFILAVFIGGLVLNVLASWWRAMGGE